MYLKIVGSLILMIAAILTGCMKAKELEEHTMRLIELKRLMVLLQGELRFHRASLAEAFENVAERVDEPFSLFLKEVSEKLEAKTFGSFEVIWKETAETLLKKRGFAKEDERILEMLCGSLGYLDLAMQMDTLNLAILQVEEMIKDAKEKQEIRGKLYRTMGITTGAMMALFII